MCNLFESKIGVKYLVARARDVVSAVVYSYTSVSWLQEYLLIAVFRR